MLTCFLVLASQDEMEREVEAWLRRKFEGRLQEVEVVHKEDLDLVSSSCK